jgi:molybdopterin synthase catalytic subunit
LRRRSYEARPTPPPTPSPKSRERGRATLAGHSVHLGERIELRVKTSGKRIAKSPGDPAIYCRILREPIDVRVLERRVAGKRNGAVLTFVGQARNVSRGREVAYLEYDAYVPMAQKMLERIASEARERWGVDVALEHRVGRIELGEPSVAVCVGSPHREEAFQAGRYCIDTLKQEVPIWKKEVCPDGAFWIEGEDAVRAT